jgi:hypothetical protein
MYLAQPNLYHQQIQKELRAWEKAMLKPPGLTNRAINSLQAKAQRVVPQKAQDFITASIQKMTETIMAGSRLLTKTERVQALSLGESDYLVEQAFKAYDKAAIAQGFGFGLGGILLGLADFPALLSIKVKFLFDCARYYGFDVSRESERLFILYIFQLAFCGDARRLELFPVIKQWCDEAPGQIDWETFQTEYRNYIDLAKLMQLLPVIGSVAGAAANHSLMKKLKITAMNCYRMRILNKSAEIW